MINNRWTSKAATRMRSYIPNFIILAIILIALYVISLQNYLLFHGIVELACIAVALCIFIIVWNTRKLITNTFFLIVGISFLFTGSIDLVHTLAYNGMGVFAGAGSDLPTQIWIEARYFQSITFLIATLFIGKSITKNRKYDTGIIFITFTLACTLLYASIFLWQNFPSCFIDGSGLTPFKIISEYIISAILVASIIVIYVKRKAFDHEVWQLLLAALVFLILGELAFTSYISVYGFMNMLGHLFRLLSVYLFYRAFVVVSLTQPYNLLFRELKENENALRESEERYRTIYDQSPIAIELYDATGTLVHINPAGLNLFGIRDMQAIQDLSLFADPNINDEQKERLHTGETVQYQGPFDFEKVKTLNRYPTSREGIIWLNVHITPLGDRADSISGFLVQILDITERKMAEEALSMSLVMDGVPTQLAYVDADLRFFYVNNAYAEWYGKTVNELKGKRITDVTGEEVFLQDLPHYQVALSGKPVSFERIIPDTEGKEHFAIITLVPHFNGELVAGFFSSIIDITERKRTEEALKTSQFQLAEAMDLAYLVNWEFDVATGLFAFDDRFYALYGTTAELEGGNHMPADVYAKKFVHPDDQYLVADEVNKAIQATDPGYVSLVEHRIIRMDGEIRHIVVRIGITKDENGRTIKTHGANQDITERKRAEDALLRVNKKLNVISNLTRQDLNSQIFVLSSYLEMAKKQLAGQDPVIATLQKGDHAVQLIHETIEYSKDYQDMGVKPPTWQNVKMALLFGLSHVSIGDIRHSIETENLEIFADPLLEKVCQRLFENSGKHGDHVTLVRVWHTVTPGGVNLVFEDDGTGIPQAKKAQIFSRDEGSGRASMRSLIFVREILDITGIMITETGVPGKGARFEMTVPKGAWRMAGDMGYALTPAREQPATLPPLPDETRNVTKQQGEAAITTLIGVLKNNELADDDLLATVLSFLDSSTGKTSSGEIRNLVENFEYDAAVSLLMKLVTETGAK